MVDHYRKVVRIDRPRPPLLPRAPPEQSSMVYIIDDDASLREMLGSLFRSIGLGGRYRVGFGVTARPTAGRCQLPRSRH